MKDWLVSQGLDPQTTRLMVTQIRHPRHRWSWNASESLETVQTRKVLIAAEMLRDYPPGFQFETQLLGSPVRFERGQGVTSQACLKFGRDPSFDSERMWFLTNELKRTEVQVIQEDLLIDPLFQFSEPGLDADGPLAAWVRIHFSNRQIELQGKVLRKKCTDSKSHVLAKSPSKSTLALLHELMRTEDDRTVARFESIFQESERKAASILEVAKSLTEVLGDGRLSPEFESSLRLFSRANGIIVRGINSKESPYVFIGSFASGGGSYSAVVKTTALPAKKPLSDLNFSTLLATEPTEETEP